MPLNASGKILKRELRGRLDAIAADGAIPGGGGADGEPASDA